jgi:hypothetical protein
MLTTATFVPLWFNSAPQPWPTSRPMAACLSTCTTIDRRGMGGRSDESLMALRTMGVSAELHARIHTEGDHVLDELPQRPALEDLW